MDNTTNGRTEYDRTAITVFLVRELNGKRLLAETLNVLFECTPSLPVVAKNAFGRACHLHEDSAVSMAAVITAALMMPTDFREAFLTHLNSLELAEFHRSPAIYQGTILGAFIAVLKIGYGTTRDKFSDQLMNLFFKLLIFDTHAVPDTSPEMRERRDCGMGRFQLEASGLFSNMAPLLLTQGGGLVRELRFIAVGFAGSGKHEERLNQFMKLPPLTREILSEFDIKESNGLSVLQKLDRSIQWEPKSFV